MRRDALLVALPLVWMGCGPSADDADSGADACNCAETDGSDGSDGVDGSDGADGADGTDGTDAIPTVEDVLAALPPCEPGATDGRIDRSTGCVDGACPGMTYDEVSAALDDPGVCSSYWYESSDGWSFSSAACVWSEGISASFEDDDADLEPDPLSTTWSIGVSPPFSGGTADGLGVGISPACFVEALGPPESVGFSYSESERAWLVDSLAYPEAGVYVYDRYDARGNYIPDGRVDALTLYGASGSF